SRACCLRRLRFSRSATARRALRAARASALPLVPVLPLVTMAALKTCPPSPGNAASADWPLACAGMPPMASIAPPFHLGYWPLSRHPACCRSSVVEHSLGKGEVVSSILTGSTRKAEQIKSFSEGALPFLPVLEREQSVFPPAKLGENPGNLFGKRSAFLDCASAKKKNRNRLE